MVIKGAKRKVAAKPVVNTPVKKVEEPAAAPKRVRKEHKVIPQLVEPEIVEAPVVEEAIEVKDEE